MWEERASPFSKKTGSKGSRAPETALLRSSSAKASRASPLSARASSSSCSTSRLICRVMVRMPPSSRSRSRSSWGPRSSSAVVEITVRGVLSSWEASATNCRCCCHTCSTGRTAQRERATLMPRKQRKLSAPMARQLFTRLFRVARSLEMSAKTRQRFRGESER